MRHTMIAGFVALAVAAPAFAGPGVSTIFENASNNGFFTPFTSNTPAGTRFSDGYWCSTGSAAPITGVSSITLGLATFGTAPAGTADIDFTFAIRDPSGLQFGPTTILHTVTIPNVALPAAGEGLASYFNLTVPLPGLTLNGNFNDWGFALGVSNFNYQGSFGFQCSVAPAFTGFQSFLASQYNPTTASWSTFSFAGEASFVARVDVPAPGAAGLAGVAGLVALRRRRA